MFKKLLLATAFAVVATSAAAVTIEPGKVYQGTFAIDSSSVTSSFPILSVDPNFSGQQYYLFFGPDSLDAGETITLKLFNAAMSETASSSYTQASFSTNALGLGLGGTLPSSGKIEVTATGGPFDLSLLDIAAVWDVVIEHPTLGPLATNIQTRYTVSDLAEVRTGDPGPGVVPLPAAGWMLLAGVAGLGALRLRKAA